MDLLEAEARVGRVASEQPVRLAQLPEDTIEVGVLADIAVFPGAFDPLRDLAAALTRAPLRNE